MTLPGSWTVASSIDEAFERIGYDPSAIEAKLIESARRSIRLLLDDWSNDQVKFWKTQDYTKTLTQGSSSFAPTTGISDVLYAMLRRNSLDIPMVVISEQEWSEIPDKSVAGMPNRLWYDKRLSPTINHWPVAENSTDQIIYTAIDGPLDSSALRSAPDVVARWNEAFVAGLAAKLAEKFAAGRLAEKLELYGGPGVSSGAYARAKVGERERGDTVISVRRRR